MGAPPVNTLTSAMTGLPPQNPPDANQNSVNRDVPTPETSRKEAVTRWVSNVKIAKQKYQPAFKRMLEDQRFAWGKQWGETDAESPTDQYVTNLTLRSVKMRTAALYAKNPKAEHKVRPRLFYKTWDGTQIQLQEARQILEVSQTPEAAMDPAIQAAVPEAQAILAEEAEVREHKKMLRKVGKTLEILYEYNLDELPQSFELLMKLAVRRAVTSGVSYLKMGWQRVLDRDPDVDARLRDIGEQLQTLERLASDIADDQTPPDGASRDDLYNLQKALSEKVEFVVKEGLTLSVLRSTSIIPDTKCTNLTSFLGADWVAEEYMLLPSEIQEVYGVDVGKSYVAYRVPSGIDEADDVTTYAYQESQRREQADLSRGGGGTGHTGTLTESETRAAVWVIHCRKDGLVYHVCDGWPQYLQEPAEPETPTDRFYPYVPLIFNEVDYEGELFPPSDVRLIRDPQKEVNRSRQGLREHRIAARPFIAVAGGTLGKADREKLINRPNVAVVELSGMGPQTDVRKLLQPFSGPPIDPNLYQVEPILDDMQRVLGASEAAAFAATGGGTATENQIAESSRQGQVGSEIDDLDHVLTVLANMGGQILLQEATPEQVIKIVGPGAVWPELSRQEISDQIILDIEAGSSGRPNRAVEIASFEKMAPFLLQMPGIDPMWMAREALRRLDDRMDLTEAFAPATPSIMSMNQANRGGGVNNPGSNPMNDPAAQGPQGQANAPQTPNAPTADVETPMSRGAPFPRAV